jgi:hypothetical protein
MVLEERARSICDPMTSDLDICRTANVLVKEYGAEQAR